MPFNVNPDIHDPKYVDIDKLYLIEFRYILYAECTFVKKKNKKTFAPQYLDVWESAWQKVVTVFLKFSLRGNGHKRQPIIVRDKIQ